MEDSLPQKKGKTRKRPEDLKKKKKGAKRELIRNAKTLVGGQTVLNPVQEDGLPAICASENNREGGGVMKTGKEGNARRHHERGKNGVSGLGGAPLKKAVTTCFKNLGGGRE